MAVTFAIPVAAALCSLVAICASAAPERPDPSQFTNYRPDLPAEAPQRVVDDPTHFGLGGGLIGREPPPGVGGEEVDALNPRGIHLVENILPGLSALQVTMAIPDAHV